MSRDIMNIRLNAIIALLLISNLAIATEKVDIKLETIKDRLMTDYCVVKAIQEKANENGWSNPDIDGYLALKEVALARICNCMADDKESNNEEDSFKKCFSQSSALATVFQEEGSSITPGRIHLGIYAEVLEDVNALAKG
jgi:hypothetical protein